jgi:Rieske Fe-S protein
MPELNPFEHGTTRRTVLRAAGLAALAGGGVGVLGACSADGEVAAPAATSAAPSASAASSSAPAASSAAPSASASSSAPAAAGASIATADVPVGSGVILKDAKYVVTQPTEGEFKAFSSICTHMGCPVAEVQGETIMCKCHGSQFSIKDGSVVKAPATKPLAEATATVSGDQVVVEA